MNITNYEELLKILEEKLIERRENGAADRFVVAVDGNCGSGKTTGIRMIANQLGCQIVQMDDFYLRKGMRTEERRSEPGGNVDYVRFAEEVLPFVRSREPFSYRKYDVPTDTFPETVEIINPEIVLIEGAYSLRPEFRKYYDLKVFSKASPELQIQRLTEREGEFVEEYKRLWIPLENRYINYFNLIEECDIVINVG